MAQGSEQAACPGNARNCCEHRVRRGIWDGPALLRGRIYTTLRDPDQSVRRLIPKALHGAGGGHRVCLRSPQRPASILTAQPRHKRQHVAPQTARSPRCPPVQRGPSKSTKTKAAPPGATICGAALDAALPTGSQGNPGDPRA